MNACSASEITSDFRSRPTGRFSPRAFANVKKHGISFDEAKSAFNDDPDHSEAEDRFICRCYSQTKRFKPGERVRLTEASFAGIKGIYQMVDSECRVMVLIELLSK